MDSCIFCKIVKGEIPSYKVWEDNDIMAFLSISPIKPGHTLVIPKSHSDYIFDLGEHTLQELLSSCKPIAQKLKTALKPKTGKVGVMVAGLEIPHVHIHLIPMDSEGDLTFANARQVDSSELEKTLNILNSVS